MAPPKLEVSKMTLHPIQLAYIGSKLAFDIANEEADRRLKPYEHLLAQGTDEARNRFNNIETGIEDQLGVWRLFDELKAAENDLIAWAVGQIKGQPEAAPYLDDIEAVYETAAVKVQPDVRAKVIDWCVNLES